MKNLVVLFASILLMTIAIEGVKAQSTATVANAQAGATIIAPLTLTNNLSLEFGKIVKSTSGGTVTVPAEAAPASRIATGGLTFLAGEWRPAKFTVNADGNQSFSITKPETITLNGPSSTMSIASNISGNVTGVSASGGVYEFYIGGVLTIASDQEIGAYTGSYEVTVQYE